MNRNVVPDAAPNTLPVEAGTEGARVRQQTFDATFPWTQGEVDRQFSDAMGTLSSQIDRLLKIGLDVFVKQQAPHSLLAIETANKGLYVRAQLYMWTIALISFSPSRMAFPPQPVIRDIVGGWHEKEQRWMLTARLTPYRPGLEEPWHPEYVALLDRIPVSTTQRRPLESSEVERTVLKCPIAGTEMR